MESASQKSRGGKSKPDEKRPEETRGESSAGRGGERQPGVWEPFEEAYRSFTTALQQANVDAQRQSWERYRDYVRACHEAQMDAQSRASEAYRSFVQTLYEQSGSEGEGEGKARDEVYRKYAETLQQVQEEGQRRVGEAWQAFQTASGAGQDQESGPERAYREYLGSLRDLWGRLDPAAVDPTTLAALAQTLSAAALSAYGAVGQGR
jgi:hypothetical protein